MTWAYLMAVAFGEKLSLRDRVILQDLLTHDALSGLKQRLAIIVAITFVAEAIGALLLYVQRDKVGFTQGEQAFHAIFNAVSGHCNAGGSTFSENLMDARFALITLSYPEKNVEAFANVD